MIIVIIVMFIGFSILFIWIFGIFEIEAYYSVSVFMYLEGAEV